jgi:hypothetical protein
MDNPLSSRVLGLLIALLLVVQPCLGAGSANSGPASFANAEQAGAAMLKVADEAATAIEIHARNRQRRKRLTAVLGGTVAAGLVIATPYIAAGATSMDAIPYVVGSGLGSFALAFGAGTAALGLVVTETTSQVRAAVENAGQRRGRWLAETMTFAPAAALDSARGTTNACDRGKQLGAVMAVATGRAPQMVEPAATAMVAALRESASLDDNLRTVTLALRAAETLGPEHPAVMVCLDYLGEVLPKSLGRDASAAAKEAALAYVYLRPTEASPLLFRFPGQLDQAELLASAADGASSRGDRAHADALLGRALDKAEGIKDVSDRAKAEARIASYPIAAERRTSLVSHAVALAQTAPPRERAQLVRALALAMAPADMELALSLLSPDGSSPLSVELARHLVEVALHSRPSVGDITLVGRMPRSTDAAPDLNRLALLLAVDANPDVRAAGARAAQLVLCVAPEIRNTEQHRRLVIDALSALALASPELAAQSVPERERRADPPLFAQAELRVGRMLAGQAVADPQSRGGQVGTAMALIRDGVSLVTQSDRIRDSGGCLAEAEAAITAGYGASPAEAIAIAEAVPEGMLRERLLMECAVAQGLHGVPGAKDALTHALARVQGVRDREARETMRARGIVGLSLVDRQLAREQLTGISDERQQVWALALMAGLEQDRSEGEWPATLAAATAAAAKVRDAEARADAITWVIDAASIEPAAFHRACEQIGLPRPQPR